MSCRAPPENITSKDGPPGSFGRAARRPAVCMLLTSASDQLTERVPIPAQGCHRTPAAVAPDAQPAQAGRAGGGAPGRRARAWRRRSSPRPWRRPAPAREHAPRCGQHSGSRNRRDASVWWSTRRCSGGRHRQQLGERGLCRDPHWRAGAACAPGPAGVAPQRRQAGGGAVLGESRRRESARRCARSGAHPSATSGCRRPPPPCGRPCPCPCWPSATACFPRAPSGPSLGCHRRRSDPGLAPRTSHALARKLDGPCATGGCHGRDARARRPGCLPGGAWSPGARRSRCTH
jgi:hypothetical protein